MPKGNDAGHGCGCSGGCKKIPWTRRLLIAVLRLLTSRRFGLKEIKREIKEIEDKLDRLVPPGDGGNFTTGPVVRDVQASSLIVKVLNNSDEDHTVTVIVFDLTQCEKTQFGSVTLDVDAGCAEEHIFTQPPVNYEVQFLGLAANVFGWTATRSQAAPSPLTASGLIAANTFRHHELVPTI